MDVRMMYTKSSENLRAKDNGRIWFLEPSQIPKVRSLSVLVTSGKIPHGNEE